MEESARARKDKDISLVGLERASRGSSILMQSPDIDPENPSDAFTCSPHFLALGHRCTQTRLLLSNKIRLLQSAGIAMGFCMSLEAKEPEPSPPPDRTDWFLVGNGGMGYRRSFTGPLKGSKGSIIGF